MWTYSGCNTVYHPRHSLGDRPSLPHNHLFRFTPVERAGPATPKLCRSEDFNGAVITATAKLTGIYTDDAAEALGARLPGVTPARTRILLLLIAYGKYD